ncbi:MAG: hypothetical protein JOZ90_02865 [Alphaproteobacteria bacterium]|nr:hypothetical protein [Alphaproteobacteria bacterium]MBV9370471.1 hypothetical protein [Alphaproteobacteria bacterium]MBV9900019.1 hypothetical protein [Alphaproteobacteria bacterium]
MKHIAILLAAVALAVPAGAQTVETGRGEFSKFPQLRKKNIPYDYNRLIAWTSDILAKGECKLKGQRPNKFDIDVPYAALVEPDGTVRRIIIQEIGCPQLETMVGSTILDMVKRGDVKPTGQDQAYWYGDRFAFARY